MLNAMKKTFLLILLILQGNLNGSLVEDGILKKNLSNNNTCLIYTPYLGIVEDIEGLDIKSDKFEMTDNEALILNGNVEIDFPSGVLKSGKARVDRKNGVVEFKKNGDIYLEDYFFKAKEGSFNKDKQSIELYNGDTFLNNRNLILSFSDLKGNLKDKIILNNVSMTSCSDSRNGWEFVAEKIQLDDQTKRGFAQKIKIKVLDRTILKLPYLPFSTSSERMTGFLEPSLSYSSDGLDFMIPYYKVISDKSDITLATRNITERGLGFEGNFRNLHGKTNNLSNFDFLYFKKDKEYESLYANQSSDRWAFSLNDYYGDRKKLWVEVDWAKASDSLVLRDISGEITSIGSQRKQNLKQNISINGSFGNFGIQVKHQGFQTLNPILTNGYKVMPSLELQFLKNFNNFRLHQEFNISYFKAKNIHGYYGNANGSNRFLYAIDNPQEGSRIFSNFNITNQTYFNGINLSSSLGLKSIKYNLDDKSMKTNSVNVPNFKIDVSTLFIKRDKMNLHILKPRFLYGYVGYEDQDMNPVFDSHKISMMNQLFNTERFSGMDRIGDQKFYTLSFEYKKRKMNMDKISLTVSKKFYLEDRKVWLDDMHMNMPINMGMDMGMMGMGSMAMPTMNMDMMKMPMDEGPLMLMGKWMPNMKRMIMAYSSYLEDQNKVPMAGITIKQSFDKGSVGYAKRYTRMAGDFMTVLDYSEFYADLKVKNNLSIIAKLKRDDDLNSKIESVFGLGYENCCFVFRLTTSDKNLSKYLPILESNSYMYLNDAWDNIIEIENKSRVNLQFEFKGLNSSFKKIGRMMDNSILKY